MKLKHRHVFLKINLLVAIFVSLIGCSVNPATGEKQFTAFLPESSEAKIGAENHEKVLAQFGYYEDLEIQNYVNAIGQSLAKHTERENVSYTFTVLDSPVVNAFAVPGGYIYITRGLMTLANDEAELASVIGHEIGHITARHSAQQQSKGVLANLGLAALSIAVDTPGLNKAASLGTELYLKSYSRAHEHQADELGIRYLSNAGYNSFAASEFLKQLEAESNLESKISGQPTSPLYYFSTHPLTGDRINETITIAGQYPRGAKADDKVGYYSKLDGMVYGPSPKDGQIVDQKFVHTDLGFLFEFPKSYKITNYPDKVVGEAEEGVIIFDGDKKQAGQPIEDYLINKWKRSQSGYATPELITINGLPAVTTSYTSLISGNRHLIRNVAIAFSQTQVFRFTFVTKVNPSNETLEGLKLATYSFKRLSQSEKRKYPPKRVKVFAAKSGDTASAIAAKMPFEKYKLERFYVLNGMSEGDALIPNKLYKTIIQ